MRVWGETCSNQDLTLSSQDSAVAIGNLARHRHTRSESTCLHPFDPRQPDHSLCLANNSLLLSRLCQKSCLHNHLRWKCCHFRNPCHFREIPKPSQQVPKAKETRFCLVLFSRTSRSYPNSICSALPAKALHIPS